MYYIKMKIQEKRDVPCGRVSSLESPTFNLFLTPVAGAFPSLSPSPDISWIYISAYGEKRQPILLGDETVQ